MSKTIVVLGATGQQGGAVVNALQAAGGFNLITPVRNPDSDAAKKLAASGCQSPTLTTFQSIEELTALFQGVDGVYAVTTFMKAGNKFDVEMEKRQGIAIAEAAAAANVPFLVFSSVASAADATGVPHFESKKYIEDLIKLPGFQILLCAPSLSWTTTAPNSSPLSAVNTPACARPSCSWLP